MAVAGISSASGPPAGAPAAWASPIATHKRSRSMKYDVVKVWGRGDCNGSESQKVTFYASNNDVLQLF